MKSSGDGQAESALDQALAAGPRGWQVFPVHSIAGDGVCDCPKGRNCKSAGKHPLIRDNLTKASTDATQIAAWAERWPRCNWGLATGLPSGLVVIDSDPRHGGDLAAIGIDRAQTVTVKTGGGGLHKYFTSGGRRISTTAGKLAPGIDVRADGGFVVMAGGLHASGKRYEWAAGLSPDIAPIADLPAHLASAMERIEPMERIERIEILKNSVRSSSSVRSVANRAEIDNAIAATLPTAAGQRFLRIFEFVRRLKAIGLGEADMATLRGIVKQWHARALPAIGTKSFDENWSDFVEAWARAKVPWGSGPVHTALARADDASTPDFAIELYEDATTLRLIRLCVELQRDAGPEPFFLTAATAGELIGLECTTAWRRLKSFVADGVLEIVELGRQGRATRFRYRRPHG